LDALSQGVPPLLYIPQNQGRTKVLLVLPTMASMVQSADKLFEIPFDTSYHTKQAATLVLLCTPFLPVPPSYKFTVSKLHISNKFSNQLKHYGTRNNVEIIL
jgi:hypothetical protein